MSKVLRQQLVKARDALWPRTHPNCAGKKRYGQRYMADDTIKEQRRKFHSISHLRAYECRHCSGWHITSDPRGNVAQFLQTSEQYLALASSRPAVELDSPHVKGD